MREGTIYKILEDNNRKVTQVMSYNLNVFAQGLLDLAVYRETVEAIIYTRRRLIWICILWLLSPIKAHDYFVKFYTKIKASKFPVPKPSKKEATCSDSPKKNETSKADSVKEILVPNKKILGADGRPIQSK